MILSKREREQQERENLIIETAIVLFRQKGYESVTMDMIAQKSELTKRTIYKYFSSKEDLFYATAYKGHQTFLKMLSEVISQRKNGFDKVRIAFSSYYNFISKYPELAKLLSNRSCSKTENIEQTSLNYKKFMTIDKFLFDNLRDIFIEGKEDGSIRSDIDIEQLAFSIIYITVGFFQLVAITGDTYPKHFGYEKDSFIQFSIDRLLESIKA